MNGVWNPPTRPLIDKAVRSILARQLADGGFNIYLQGPSEISATVKAYFALKLAGVSDYNDPRLTRARERILALGGIQAANSYVKINLSLFDSFPREACAVHSARDRAAAGNFIYQMSSWTRAIVIPLAIVHGKSAASGAGRLHSEELFLPGAPMQPEPDPKTVQLAQRLSAAGPVPEGLGEIRLQDHPPAMPSQVRRQWMLEHTRHTDGVAAIYPPMMYVIMALDLLGYAPGSSAARGSGTAVRQADGGRLSVSASSSSPAFRVVWDTAIAAFALAETANPSGDDGCAAPRTGC